MEHRALLALEDGNLFYGQSIGVDGQAIGEVVFNTSMTGYQEILTDPSYCRQIVTFTQPHIGNVGCNHNDQESKEVFASGMVIRDLPSVASNWRANGSLCDYLKGNDVVAIANIDTRKLTRILRDKGSMKGCIVTGTTDAEQAIKEARKFPGLSGMDLCGQVTTAESYTWEQGYCELFATPKATTAAHSLHVVAYDFGIKHNLLRILAEHGCHLTVVPADTLASAVMAMRPDGVFLSNGPGDPAPCDYAITAIRELLREQMPLFGVCLGHQLLSLALGAKTLKMKFGHHGANHPVQCLDSGQVMICSQNHGFAVDESSLPNSLRATHRSLFDGSLQGVHHNELPAFSLQGHPEASPGPHDMHSLFKHFINLMETAC